MYLLLYAYMFLRQGFVWQHFFNFAAYRFDVYDRNLVHAIESVIIEWTHQIREVLKRDSAQLLLEGQNPTPFVELKFWQNKAQNLECIYDQVCTRFLFQKEILLIAISNC